MTVLGRRLETYYSKKRGKIGTLRSGYGEDLFCPTVTIRSKRMRDGSRHWTLFSGDQLTAPEHKSKTFRVRTDISTIHLITWCVINKIIDENTVILMDYDSDPVNEADIHKLTKHIVHLFKPIKINSIPREKLLTKSHITECLVVLNFESSRLKAHVDQIAVIYSTSWGERFIHIGKSKFQRIMKACEQQRKLPNRLMIAPQFNHQQRVEESFLELSPIEFKTLP